MRLRSEINAVYVQIRGKTPSYTVRNYYTQLNVYIHLMYRAPFKKWESLKQAFRWMKHGVLQFNNIVIRSGSFFKSRAFGNYPKQVKQNTPPA